MLTNEVLAEVPATRTYGNVLAMVPGVQSLTLDVNSTQSMTGTATNFFFTSRGGRGNEGTVQVDGMNVGSAFGGGGVSSFAYDFVNAQEVQVTVAGGMGESRPRRAGVQHHSQDRRQHLQRLPRSSATPASGRRAATSTMTCAASASRSRRD